MTDLCLSTSGLFGTNFKERRLSKRAKKAMVTEFVLPEDSYEMTYEDTCETDGGIGIATIKALGVCGAAVSIACSVVLALDKVGWIKLGFWEKLGLKLCRLAGDIVSTIAFTSLAAKKVVGNFIAGILSKKFGGVVGANVLAFAFKTTANLSHFASLFE